MSARALSLALLLAAVPAAPVGPVAARIVVASHTCASETATIIACVDGDTCTLDREIMPGRDRLRLANTDSPELGWRAECLAERLLAERAREYIQQFVGATVTLTEIARDKYATRVDALAMLPDGQDLGRVMIAAGLATAWRGRQTDWCGR